jgi:hypothetical protein
METDLDEMKDNRSEHTALTHSREKANITLTWQALDVALLVVQLGTPPSWKFLSSITFELRVAETH